MEERSEVVIEVGGGIRRGGSSDEGREDVAHKQARAKKHGEVRRIGLDLPDVGKIAPSSVAWASHSLLFMAGLGPHFEAQTRNYFEF